ncbi:flagellar hook-basal body complex protein FliE [Anaerosinus sp.]
MQVEKLQLTPVRSSAINNINQAAEVEGKSFGDFFKESLNEVNDLQLKSRDASINLAAGKVNDISQVVIAGEKAGVALQLTMQIRNKVVEAYQEVMRMQV